MDFIYFSVFFTFFYPFAECAKILFIPSMVSPSHKIPLIPWADALAARGHDVLMWSPVLKPDKYVTKVAKTQQFEVAIKDQALLETFKWENGSFFAKLVWEDENRYHPGNCPSFIAYSLLKPMIREILVNPTHRKQFDAILEQKWDLMVLDELFNPLGFTAALLTKTPVIIACTTVFTHWAAHYAGIPNPPSYIPPMGLPDAITDKQSFSERIQSALLSTYSIALDEAMMYLTTLQLREFFPNLPNLRQARIDPEFVFVHHYRALEFARILPPNVIYTGGIHLKAEANISTDIEEFIQTGKKGFILVAMGHLVNWDVAPTRAKHAFNKALSQVPEDYAVIWQYTGTPPTNLPKHVRTYPWLPQPALIAHPKIRLFLSHCGGSSVVETAHYGVPVLGIPFFGDQYDNIARFVSKGAGLRLRKTSVEAQEITEKINSILTDPSYANNARRISEVIRFEPLSAADRAVFWTEFAVKHVGANYLKSSVGQLSIIQYYMLDVLAAFGVILWLTLKISRKICATCWGCIRKSPVKQNQTKKSKKA